MSDLAEINRKLGYYALGHGGHFEVAEADNVVRVLVDFDVYEISDAMRFVDRILKKSSFRANVTAVLGEARRVDKALLAASVRAELERYAEEDKGRFHVSPWLDETSVLSRLEIYADFEIGEAAAENWLVETIWMFGLQATGLSWRFINDEGRRRLGERSEVIGK